MKKQDPATEFKFFEEYLKVRKKYRKASLSSAYQTVLDNLLREQGYTRVIFRRHEDLISHLLRENHNSTAQPRDLVFAVSTALDLKKQGLEINYCDVLEGWGFFCVQTSETGYQTIQELRDAKFDPSLLRLLRVPTQDDLDDLVMNYDN